MKNILKLFKPILTFLKPNLVSQNSEPVFFNVSFNFPDIIQNERFIKYQRSNGKKVSEWIVNKKDRSQLALIHEDIKKMIEVFKSQSLKKVSPEQKIDIAGENKALMWIQTSFVVLDGALNKCLKDKNLVPQGFIWIDNKPEELFKILRFTAFNIDCTLLFNTQNELHIMVYNDKNNSHGSSEEPALKAIFHAQKPAVLNEVIKILNLMGQIFEEMLV